MRSRDRGKYRKTYSAISFRHFGTLGREEETLVHDSDRFMSGNVWDPNSHAIEDTLRIDWDMIRLQQTPRVSVMGL